MYAPRLCVVVSRFYFCGFCPKGFYRSQNFVLERSLSQAIDNWVVRSALRRAHFVHTFSEVLKSIPDRHQSDRDHSDRYWSDRGSSVRVCVLVSAYPNLRTGYQP